MSSIEVYKGNRRVWGIVIPDENNAPADITGQTVTLSMRRADSAELKIDGASCSPVDLPNGAVSYAPAAGDVDTVGLFKAWCVTAEGGLLLDTPEFDVRIIEHAPDAVSLPNPVGAGGRTSIIKGDSYLAAHGRDLVYQVAVQDGPDLTGKTVTWRVENQLEVTATVVGEDDVSVDVTSAETATLQVGTWDFELEATVASGEVVTLLRSQIDVAADVDGPA